MSYGSNFGKYHPLWTLLFQLVKPSFLKFQRSIQPLLPNHCSLYWWISLVLGKSIRVVATKPMLGIDFLDNKHDTFNVHKNFKTVTEGSRPRSNYSKLDKKSAKQNWTNTYYWKNSHHCPWMFWIRNNTQWGNTCNERIKKQYGILTGQGVITKLFEEGLLKLITTSLLNQIYVRGKLIGGSLVSTFILLTKNASTTRCSDTDWYA